MIRLVADMALTKIGQTDSAESAEINASHHSQNEILF